MNFEQPALGAIKSYYRQILTQLDAICELAYTESERPINTYVNSDERPEFCEQLAFYSETRCPACQSANCDAQELSAEFAKLVQLSTSLLNLPLNIKHTDAAMPHHVQLHPTFLPIICSAL